MADPGESEELKTVRDRVAWCASDRQKGESLIPRLEAAIRADERRLAAREARVNALGMKQAREGAAALTDAACPVEQADAALDALEAAIRASERAAVARRLRARIWYRTIDLDTVETIIDFILDGDGNHG